MESVAEWKASKSTPSVGKSPISGGLVPVSSWKATRPTTAAVAPKPVTTTDNSLWGMTKNFITGLPDAATTVGKSIGNYITGSVADQWNQGQQQLDQASINKATLPQTFIQRQAQGLEGASGIGTKLTAPLAPIFSAVGKGVEAYINSPYVQKIINDPEYQKFALSPAGETTSKYAENISNAANVAMVALGGIEGVKAIVKGEVPSTFKSTDIEPPGGGPGTGTYPPATIRPDTVVGKPLSVAEWKTAGKPETPIIPSALDKYSGAPINQVKISDIEPTSRGTVKQGTIDSVVKDGVQRPIEIKRNGDKLTVVDGANRLEGARQRGDQSVPSFFQEERPAIEPLKPIETKADTKLKSSVYERMQMENPALEGDVNYDPIKLKEDAGRAVDLIAKDKQKAFNIAMGKETSPEITSTAVNIAMAEKALSEGNTSIYTRLIKNRSLEQTRRGQELVAEKGSVTDNSTSRYVKELISLRLESLGKKYLSDLKDTLKQTNKNKATSVIEKEVAKAEKQIKNKSLKMEDARSLLDALSCV